MLQISYVLPDFLLYFPTPRDTCGPTCGAPSLPARSWHPSLAPSPGWNQASGVFVLYSHSFHSLHLLSLYTPSTHRGALQPASQANTTSFPTSSPSRPSRQHSLTPRGVGGPLKCVALCHLLACVGSSLFCFEVCLCACACRRQEVISAAPSWRDANEALMNETIDSHVYRE